MASFPVTPNFRPLPPRVPEDLAQAAKAGALPQDLIDKLGRWFAPASGWDTGYVSLPENTSIIVRPPESGRIALGIALSSGAVVYIGRDDSVAVPPATGGTNGFLCPSLLVFGPENPLAVYAICAAGGQSLTWLALYE